MGLTPPPDHRGHDDFAMVIPFYNLPTIPKKWQFRPLRQLETPVFQEVSRLQFQGN